MPPGEVILEADWPAGGVGAPLARRFLDMKQLMAISACVALSLSLGVAAPIPKELKSVPFFPTKIGTKWVYKSDRWGEFETEIWDAKEKDGVTNLTIVNNSSEMNADPFWIIAVSQKGMSVISEESFHYKPSIDWLRLPAKVGDQWKFDSSLDIASSRISTLARGRMKISALEKVKTPAGEFEAIRVEGTGSVPGPWNETHWFAPKIGLIKWVNNAHDVFVLKSFTPAK
jgi:hypothetical protein